MKIISLGGGFVSEHLPYRRYDTRIQNETNVENIIEIVKPDVIVNCIGKTGRPNVDWCETHKEETAFSNIVVPVMLAESCARHSVQLIQVGSGCIYFGESPHYYHTQYDGSPMPPKDANFFVMHYPCKKYDTGWEEDDFANPKSFYSKTKYACDLAIGSMKHVTTLRIRMPVSKKVNPRNLINKLRGYKQVIDIPNSMTFMDDFVRCVEWAAKEGQTGVFHVTNPQPLTATQIMREYQKYVPDHTFDIISEQQLDQLTVAKRSNCILSSQKLNNAGFTMTPSSDALAKCMDAYTRNTLEFSHVK